MIETQTDLKVTHNKLTNTLPFIRGTAAYNATYVTRLHKSMQTEATPEHPAKKNVYTQINTREPRPPVETKSRRTQAIARVRDGFSQTYLWKRQLGTQVTESEIPILVPDSDETIATFLGTVATTETEALETQTPQVTEALETQTPQVTEEVTSSAAVVSGPPIVVKKEAVKTEAE